MNRQSITDEARKWLGVKWKHQGRTREGVDCAGLIIVVGKTLGLMDYDTRAYSRRPTEQQFLFHFIDAGLIRRPVDDAEDGDILVTMEHSYPCHVVFRSTKYGKPHIIHSHLPKRKVSEEPLTDFWLAKRVACFSFPDRED